MSVLENKNCDIKKLTIWVGAGISIKEPSRLPSGNQLAEFAFSNIIIGKDKLLEIWNQINLYEENHCNVNVVKFPRLELLLSSIAYIEKFFMDKGGLNGHFLSGLQAFDEVPINENHMLLAMLINAGARVMTANFDLGIERAYKKLYKKECNNIVHFHGTYLSGDRMGATIENITHFVNKTVAGKVKSSFGNTSSNYFFGYSFSDVYDINAAIYDLYFNTDSVHTKDNWICNHNGWDNELASKVQKTFKVKDNYSIFEDETTEALKSLCRKYSVDISVLKKNNYEIAKDSKHNWDKLFQEKIKITEEFKILSTIHFLNRMGIAVDKVDMKILEKYEKMQFVNDKKELLEYHLAANSKYWYKKYGDTRLLTEYHKRELHKRQAKTKLEAYVEENSCKRKPEDIIRSLNRKKFVMYEDFNELNRYMTKIKMEMIVNAERKDLFKVKSLIDDFSKFPVGKYISIILYASIYRYRMLIESKNEAESQENKERKENFCRANEIYYDIGNVDGIVSSQIDFLISDNYKKNAEYWSLIFQTPMWRTLMTLCKVTGSYRYEEFIEILETIKGGDSI